MEFKTKTGTKLPLLDLRGKQYLQVAHRLVWFREEHPSWSIVTEYIFRDDKSAIAKATIVDDDGRVIATAHKTENKQSFGDFLEKCETGAIGRALALCGYGTQFTPELEEGDRIVDSPIEYPHEESVAQFDDAPECRQCKRLMMKSKFDIDTWYCSKCKIKQPMGVQ